MTVLRHFHIIHNEVSGNAVDGNSHICLVQCDGGFRNDVTHTVTDEYLHGNAGIFSFCIRQIHQSTGNPVCHLIRVARIYFFKHGVTPFSHGAGVP